MTKEDIQVRRDKRMTYQQIGDEFGVSRQRVHQIYKDYVTTKENIRWEVLQFHEHRCVICRKTHTAKNPLHVHHMDGVKTNNEFSNLTVLCRKHHYECEIEERRKLGLHQRTKNVNTPPDIEMICIVCGKAYFVRPYRYITKQNYCSKECRIKTFKRTAFNCLTCGKEKVIKTHIFKKQGGKYCSSVCFGASIRLSPTEKKVNKERNRVNATNRARQRYTNDPIFRAKSMEAHKKWYARKKAENLAKST